MTNSMGVNEGENTTTDDGISFIEKPGILMKYWQWKCKEKYDIQKIIGRGSYGEVARAFLRSENETTKAVAVKRVANLYKLDIKKLFREMYILRRLNHPNIIALTDVMATSGTGEFGETAHNIEEDEEFLFKLRRSQGHEFLINELYLVFEYAETDLCKLLQSPQYLSRRHIQSFMYQILVALKYIHSANVIHRDIKPANILLYKDCRLKLCDFGLARIVSQECAVSTPRTQDETSMPEPVSRQLTRHVVTRWYRAPELILLSEYTGAVDMWSVGCVFAELLAAQEGSRIESKRRMPLFPGGSCPTLSRDEEETSGCLADQLSAIISVLGSPAEDDITIFSNASAQAYLRSKPHCAPKNFSIRYPSAAPDSISLLENMLKFNPDRRISVNDAIQSEFIAPLRTPPLELTMDQGLSPDFELQIHSMDAMYENMQTELKLYSVTNGSK